MKAHKTPTQACYWIIGEKTESPAVAIDLHDKNCELCGETYTAELCAADYQAQAKECAEAYAAARDIPASQVTYDEDSTACFAWC